MKNKQWLKIGIFVYLIKRITCEKIFFSLSKYKQASFLFYLIFLKKKRSISNKKKSKKV